MSTFARKLRIGDTISVKPTLQELPKRLAMPLQHITGFVYAHNGKFYDIVCEDGNELRIRRSQAELVDNCKIL